MPLMPSLHRHTEYSVWSYQWHAKETLISKNDLLDIFEICFNPLQHVLKLRKLFKVSGHLLLGIAKVFSCLCIETSKYFPHCYVTHTHTYTLKTRSVSLQIVCRNAENKTSKQISIFPNCSKFGHVWTTSQTIVQTEACLKELNACVQIFANNWCQF